VRLAPLLLLGLATSAFAGQDKIYTAKEPGTAPAIDGTVNLDEWANATLFEGGVDETSGVPRTEPIKYYLTYDKDFVYFAAQVTLKDPKSVRASQVRQNVSLRGDDFVRVRLDPFGRNGGYNQFSFNAKGATQINIAGGRAPKVEWLGEIRAKGRLTEFGWEGEARIPWAVMRLPDGGVNEVGINFNYEDPRLDVEYDWSWVRQGLDSEFGLWTGLNVPAVKSGRSVKFLPYVYGGLDANNRHIANAGLDFKTSLTPQIDAVATINPDFRNIENQVLGLEFSYFERLANEARPFFLEGAEFFSTSRDTPLFASQRIGKFDFGAKAVGKINDQASFGLLTTLDFGNQANIVGQFSNRFNENWRMNSAFTSRNESGNGNKNDAGFLSLNYSTQSAYAFAQVSGTKDRREGFGRRYNVGGGFNGTGYFVGLEYLEISEDFRARNGFARERDLRGYELSTNFQQSNPKGTIRNIEYGVYGNLFDRINGDPYRKNIGIYSNTRFSNAMRVNFGGEVGKFEQNHDRTIYLGTDFNVTDPFNSFGFGATFGQLGGLPYRQYVAAMRYRPIQPLNFSLRYEIQDYGDRTNQAVFTVSYDIDDFWSLSGRAVYRDEGTNAYVALRRAGNRGAEYFLILGDPNSEKFQRQLVLKATFPFEWKF
jgi:hypothetical protein